MRHIFKSMFLIKMCYTSIKRELKKLLIFTSAVFIISNCIYICINLKTKDTRKLYHEDLTKVITSTEDQLCFITINEKGRLGNKMFIYAALLGIAAKNNMKPILEKYSNLFDIFQVPMLKYAVNQTLFRQLSFEAHGNIASRIYTSSMENLPQRNIFLKGYFQSHYYFKGIHTHIRKEFTFNPTLVYSSNLFLHNQLNRFNLSVQNTVLIGIHVRRGDATSDIHQRKGFSVPGKQYFVHAMARMRSKILNNIILWIVASNDHKWCHKNIQILPGEYIAYSIGDAALDLAVLSNCNHTVMSVGSFSWWAAWLAGGEACYYRNWPTPNTPFARKTNLTTYYPPSWISVE